MHNSSIKISRNNTSGQNKFHYNSIDANSKALAILPWHRTISDIKIDTGVWRSIAVAYAQQEDSMDAEKVILAVREGRSLTGQNLAGLDLSGQNLKNAQLQDANMSDCNLRKADLRGSNLSNVNFFNADLRGAKLRGANLTGSNRMQAKILKWGLKGAYIAGPTAYAD